MSTWQYIFVYALIDLKGTEWVGLELNIILTQTVGRFNKWVTPYTGILTLEKLKYFMYKDLSSKTLKSCTAANNTRRDIQSVEQEILSAQVKPDRPIQNFFDDSNEIEIRLPLLTCLNNLEYIWWLLNSEL